MDETAQRQSGPELEAEVQEVQGRFPNDAALQDALARLTLAGFDHADFSLPQTHPTAPTPDEGATAVADDIDKRQLRTMTSGLAGASAASLAAGALIATGGVAAGVVAAAAAAAGAVTMAGTTGAGLMMDHENVEARNRLGAAGKLILAVRTPTEEKVERAVQSMRDAGATDVNRITRADEALTRGVSASSWTGD